MCNVIIAALLAATAPSLAFAVSCGDVLTRDTTLDADLHCGRGDALTIAQHGVVLDLNGHRLVGNGEFSTGVRLERAHSVIVRNGSIEGFGVGIEATRSEALQVHDVSFRNGGDGVRLHNASHARITNNRFEQLAGHAVAVLALPWALTNGGQHEIRNNLVAGSEYGVLLSGYYSGDSVVAGNRFEDVGTIGVVLDHRSGGNRIERNSFGVVGVAEVAY